MLHRDYLLEMIEQFVTSVSQALRQALFERDFEAVDKVEEAVADIMQLDPSTAMALAPESMVTMMSLSGTGDAVAGYAAYALNKLGDAYDAMGEPEVAQYRRDQAAAVAEAFGTSLEEIPAEFLMLEAELAGE